MLLMIYNRRKHFTYESNTISHTFNAYYMNLYSRNLWRFNNLRDLKPLCIYRVYGTEKTH